MNDYYVVNHAKEIAAAVREISKKSALGARKIVIFDSSDANYFAASAVKKFGGSVFAYTSHNYLDITKTDRKNKIFAEKFVNADTGVCTPMLPADEFLPAFDDSYLILISGGNWDGIKTYLTKNKYVENRHFFRAYNPARTALADFAKSKKRLAAPDLKKALLGALSHFSAFCAQGGLRFFLLGEALLSAHNFAAVSAASNKLCVGMPYPDWVEFNDTFVPADEYAHINPLAQNHASNLFYYAQLFDARTVAVQEHLLFEQVSGAGLSIFPIVALPPGGAAAASEYFDYADALMGAFNAELLTAGDVTEQAALYFNRLQKLLGEHDWGRCENVGVLPENFKAAAAIPRACCDSPSAIPCDNLQAPVFASRDIYLEQAYGADFRAKGAPLPASASANAAFVK
jgi:hypothetical protein